MLTSKQRAYLRALAVNEDTILMIGKGGIDGDVVKQAADAIYKRELIKGKVLETAPVSPREAAEALAEQTESEVVQVIGSKFALYKRHPKEPKIVLPKEKRAYGGGVSLSPVTGLNRPAAAGNSAAKKGGGLRADRNLRRDVQPDPSRARASRACVYRAAFARPRAADPDGTAAA